MSVCDVILTDAGNEVGYRVAVLLTKAGFSVLACDRNPQALERLASCATTTRRTLAARDERNFVRQISRLEKEFGARIIIPIFHAEVLARHRDEFRSTIPAPDSEILVMLDDKVSACDFAGRLGIRQPQIYSSPSEVYRYPAVFKRSAGHGGDSVYFPKSASTLEHLVSNSLPGTYLITEEVDGYDASVDAIRWRGRFYASAYKVLVPRAKGSSIVRCSIDNPLMIGTARLIMEECGFEGVCGFDFRVTPDGEVYFLECNPRFTGGVGSAAASGLNLPVMLCHLALGHEVHEPEIRTGRITVSWRELLRRAVASGFNLKYFLRHRP